MVVLPKTTRDIGEHLSQLHTQEKKDNRQIFLKILQNVQFHRSLTESLDLIEIANYFVNCEHRLTIFGKFCSTDVI